MFSFAEKVCIKRESVGRETASTLVKLVANLGALHASEAESCWQGLHEWIVGPVECLLGPKNQLTEEREHGVLVLHPS